MDPKDSIPAENAPADVVADAPVDSPAADDGTGAKANDPAEPSKSTDTPAADGDKTPTATGADDTPALKLDEDLDDWITKRGLPAATTDDQKKAYQQQRDEQRAYTRDQQAAKAAQDAKDFNKVVDDTKSDTPVDDDEFADPLEKRLNAAEARADQERTIRLQSEFYTENKVTADEHQALLDVYKEKAEKASKLTNEVAKKAAIDYWSSPEALPDLLEQAKARVTLGTDTTALTDEAARKERERIAKESQASSPSRQASTTTTTDKSEDAARTERFKARFNT